MVLSRHFRLIWRRISTQPLYPSISIAGLTIAFITTLLVAGWIKSEMSFDRMHPNYTQTYRLTVEIENRQSGMHWDFARSYLGWLKDIKNELPGVESLVRLGRWSEGVVRVDKEVYDENILKADSNLTDLFALDFIYGNPEQSLAKPFQVIISESTAKKYFGRINPLDKVIFLYCSRCTDQIPYRVSGVFRDLPEQNHVHFSVVASLEKPEEALDWAWYYVGLEENIPPEEILNRFNEFAANHVSEDELNTFSPHLQPISDIHLKSKKSRELEVNGNIKQVRLIGVLALFVLIISLFNIFNIRMAQLIKQLPQLQIMRFNGATTVGLLKFQFSETFFYYLIATSFSLGGLHVLSPLFSKLMHSEGIFEIPGIMRLLIFTYLSLGVITLLAGILPFLLFHSKGALQRLITTKPYSHNLSGKSSSHRLLNSVLGLQYIATFFLLVAVWILNAQLNLFMENRLGSEEVQIINLEEIPCQVIDKFQAFKGELTSHAIIHDVTATMEKPGDEVKDMMGFETSGISEDKSNKMLYIHPVDYNFFKFYNLPLLAGKYFPEHDEAESSFEYYILNESAVKFLGWTTHEAIGKPFALRSPYYSSEKSGQIIGVVADFHEASMKSNINPGVYFRKSFWLFNAQIKYDTANTNGVLSLLDETWQKFYPGYPFQYEFSENYYRYIYKEEYQLRNMSMVLCIIAIVLSAVGLLGITGLTYQQRTKEIGIRKVNGARSGNILQWLIRKVLYTLTLAILASVPLSYLVFHNWLKNYTVQIQLHVWIFILCALVLYIMCVTTVGWQSWITSRKNPVDALKTE